MPAVRVATSAEPLARYRPQIERYVRSLVRNRDDAADLTQETFLRAHRQREELEDPAALCGWLHRIATNVCTDFLRAAARRAAREGGPADEEEEADVPSQGIGPDALVERGRMNACGAEFLARLPRSHRRVILLHDLLGLSSVEIARLLRSTPGAVKIRLHRARQQFRAELEAGCEFTRDERGVLVGGRKLPKPLTAPPERGPARR